MGTMIKGEIGVLKKKQAEEERRKQMAEGLAKFQAILGQAAAEREAAQAINDDCRAKIAEIKAAEKAAEGAAASFASFTAAVDNERSNLKATIANTKATLTKTKDETGKELAAAKAKYEASSGGYQKLKTKAIALEADKTAMKGNITVIADAIAALDKKAAAALVEKREMWSTISAVKFTTNKQTTSLYLSTKDAKGNSPELIISFDYSCNDY